MFKKQNLVIYIYRHFNCIHKSWSDDSYKEIAENVEKGLTFQTMS